MVRMKGRARDRASQQVLREKFAGEASCSRSTSPFENWKTCLKVCSHQNRSEEIGCLSTTMVFGEHGTFNFDGSSGKMELGVLQWRFKMTGQKVAWEAKGIFNSSLIHELPSGS